MRWLVFLAVVITLIAVLMYSHPNGNLIDWFANQKPGTTTSTMMNQPDRGGAAVPFADLAMAPDGTSPLQGANPAPARQNSPPQPVPSQPVPQQTPQRNFSTAPPPPKQPKSARDKIYNLAKENEVTIIKFVENPIGNVTVTCQAKDKNNIYDFWDALLKFGIRDFDQSKGAFNIQMDPDGRTLVTSTFKFKYMPEY